MPQIDPRNYVLTVVIPCFNEARTIRRIVDAVRASVIVAKEIIVVDDCSTDGTIEILKSEIARQDAAE
jgi:glycosyltransferase involved in cell wall biosynthesis